MPQNLDQIAAAAPEDIEGTSNNDDFVVGDPAGVA